MEDHALELSQLGARSQPELVAQERTRLAVGGKRLGLAARAIQGQHLLSAESLLQWCLRDQPLQIDNDLGRVTQRQLGVDPLHLGEQAELLKPPDVGLHPLDRRQVGKRWAAPQGERFAQQSRGCRRIVLRQAISRLLHQRLERRGVELSGLELERVATATGEEHRAGAVPECPPQAGHRDVNGVDLAARPRAPEQLLDQALGADRLVRVHQQYGEQCALALPAERKRLTVPVRRHRPEDSKLHRGSGLRAHPVDYQQRGGDSQRAT